MKVICNRSELDRGLSIASGAVSVRTPKPVLQCVRLTAAGGVLSLQATDLEVALRYTLSAVDVSEEGEVLVPADRIRGIASNSADETLSLTNDDSKLVIRGADAMFEIYGSEVTDFPPIADFSEEAGIRLTAGVLKDLIRKVVYAAAKENTRYAIHGVRWEASGKQLRLIATDGRRLAKSWGPCEGAAKEVGAILPPRAMSLLNNLLTDSEEEVTIRIGENQAQIQTKSAVLTTQLVEGTFPRYEDVIPKDNDRRVEFATSELFSAVRRASLLTNEESRGVKFSFKDNLLTLSSRVAEYGSAEIKLPVKYGGPALDIGFNPDFMIDALKVVDTDSMTLELKDGTKPGLLKTAGGFVYVIMPVSLA